MHFEQIYPEFDDADIRTYEMLSNAEGMEDAKNQFRIASIHNAKEKKIVLSTALFAKPPDPGLQEIKIPEDLNKPHPSIRRGEATWNDAFWDRFVAGLDKLREAKLDWTVRVHLAQDLAPFYLERLIDLDVEVRVMGSSSILHNPGACWRYLAGDDAEIWFARDIEDLCPTYIELPLMQRFISWVSNEEVSGPRFFRICWNADYDDVTTVYRPASGGGCGGARMSGITRALEAWHWFGSRYHELGDNPLSNFHTRWHFHPVRGVRELFGYKWPKYGGDEQFAGQYLYWRHVRAGEIFTVVGFTRPHIHVLMQRDLANVLRHRPNAFIMQFDEPGVPLNA